MRWFVSVIWSCACGSALTTFKAVLYIITPMRGSIQQSLRNLSKVLHSGDQAESRTRVYSSVSIQTQSLALRALRKRKPQETQALALASSQSWLPLLWFLAVFVYATQVIAIEWKPGLWRPTMIAPPIIATTPPIHTVSQKGATKLMAVTSGNHNQFSKLFYQ